MLCDSTHCSGSLSGSQPPQMIYGITTCLYSTFQTTTTTTGNQTIQQQIIIQPPPPKPMKNKTLMCKPITQTKATSCRPHTQTKETQTGW